MRTPCPMDFGCLAVRVGPDLTHQRSRPWPRLHSGSTKQLQTLAPLLSGLVGRSMHGLLHLGVGTGGGAASSGQEKGRARRIPIQTQLVNELALGGFTFSLSYCTSIVEGASSPAWHNRVWACSGTM